MMILSFSSLFVNGVAAARSVAAGGRRPWVCGMLMAQAACGVLAASAAKYTSSGVR